MNGLFPSVANHLWQSTLFAAGAWGVAFLLRRHSAAVRFWVWVAASAKFLIPFSLLVGTGGLVEWRSRPSLVVEAPRLPVVEIGAPFLRPAGPPADRPEPDLVAMALWAIWAAGAGLGLISWARQWRRIRIAAAAGTPAQIAAGVTIILTKERWAPGVFGIFRPVVLLPEGMAETLTPGELRSILSHEAAHIRRRDNLWAALQTAAEIVFWFYPPVRWVGARLLDERERACDEAVTEVEDAHAYAEAILAVCRLQLEASPVCLAGVGGARLRERVVAIAARQPVRRIRGWQRALLASACASAVAVPFGIGVWNAPARAQSADIARERFEVASVKLVPAGTRPDGHSLTTAHGTVAAKVEPLSECIRWAYGLSRADQVEGPSWISTEEFDITAKAAPDTPDERLRVMMQELLAERFRLVLHTRTEDRPIYALTVGKGSPRLKKVDREPERGFMIVMSPEEMTYRMVADMPKLISILPTFLDRPVIDRTNLTGVYEFALRVEMNPGFQLPPVGQRFNGFGMTPGIFRAVEELGLKLEDTRGPVQRLIVDRVERPSEN